MVLPENNHAVVRPKMKTRPKRDEEGSEKPTPVLHARQRVPTGIPKDIVLEDDDDDNGVFVDFPPETTTIRKTVQPTTTIRKTSTRTRTTTRDPVETDEADTVESEATTSSTTTDPSETIDPTAPAVPNEASNESSGLPIGAIVGIVIGVLALFFLIGAIVFWRRRRQIMLAEAEPANMANEKFHVVADHQKEVKLPDASVYAEADGAGAVWQPSELPAMPVVIPGTPTVIPPTPRMDADEIGRTGGAMGATLNSQLRDGGGRGYVNSWSAYGDGRGTQGFQGYHGER